MDTAAPWLLWAVPVLVIAVGGAAALATGGVLRLLQRWAVFDHPNDRSSHVVPTPRGGGLAVIPVTAAAWLVVSAVTSPVAAMSLAASLALALAALFWLDDLRHLPIGIRLAAQAAAVAAMLWLAPFPGPVFGGILPPVADAVAAGLLWLWFINLFNFMDGTDGISGVEAGSVGVGVALVVGLAGLHGSLLVAGLTLAAAAAGFLVWNWQPAKIFLGDVGSVPLGFLLGWLLLEIAARGQPLAALIVPAYYLADSGITIGRRFVRGERIWRAHREHYYQQAVKRGMSHANVARHVLAANVVLIGLAALAVAGHSAPALVGAVFTVSALLMRLAGPRRRGPLDAAEPSAVGKAAAPTSPACNERSDHDHPHPSA